jgi:hypothetical protein
MSMRTKIFGALVAATMLSALTVVPAHAANTDKNNDSTPGFTVNAGSGPRFDIDQQAGGGIYPTVENFSDVTMNGTPQLTSAVVPPFTVIDDTGSGSGWNVTFTLPNFADTHSHGNAVDASGASMNAAVIMPGTPDSALGGVYSIGVQDMTTAVKVLKADPGNYATGTDTVNHGNGFAPVVDGVHVAGMGTYLISPQIVKLVVPSNTHADDYQTTANFTIASGP